MGSRELLQWRLDSAQRADDLERSLGDIFDVKAGLVLVAVTFLIGVSVQLLTMQVTNPAWLRVQIVAEVVALGLLILSGVMTVVELYPRKYKFPATPLEDERWIQQVSEAIEGNQDKVLDAVQKGKLDKAVERVEINRKQNETKSRQLRVAFQALVLAAAIILVNVLAVAGKMVCAVVH